MSEHFSPHWYYADSVKQFVSDCGNRHKCRALRKMLERANSYHGDFKGDREANSWEYSPPALANFLKSIDLPGDQVVMLEYRLDTRQRIDAILCGKDRKGIDTALILEIKQWYEAGRAFDLLPSDKDGMIEVCIHGRSTPYIHPSVQVQDYSERLDFLEKKNLKCEDAVTWTTAVYMHRLREWIPAWQDVLMAEKFKEVTDHNPIYLADDPKLIQAVQESISHGSGLSALQKFGNMSPMK